MEYKPLDEVIEALLQIKEYARMPRPNSAAILFAVARAIKAVQALENAR